MTTPPKIGGPSYTGGMGGTGGSTVPTVPTQGFYYNMQQGDTWPGLSQLAYGDPSLWQDLAQANPGKQAKKGERVFVPKRQDLGGVGTAPGADARRILDDGRPAPGALPDGDPALAGELNAARTAANVGNTGTPNPNVTTETERGGALVTDENVHHSGGGGSGVSATGGVVRKRWRGDVLKAEEKYEGNIGGADVRAEGQVTALSAQGEAKAGWGRLSARNTHRTATYFDEMKGGSKEYKGAMYGAEAGARGRLELVGAQGQASASYGNDVIGGKTSIKGEAWVGAEAGAVARVGVSKHGVDIGAGVDAFAGAKIRGKLQQDLTVGGERLGSVAARAEGWAGAGVVAKGYANIGKGDDGRYHIKAGGKLGVALGLGGALSANIDIDVTGVVNTAKKVGDAVGGAAKAVTDTVSDGFHATKEVLDKGAEAVVDFAAKKGEQLANSTVGKAVTSGAQAVGDAVKSGWGKVKSIFW